MSDLLDADWKNWSLATSILIFIIQSTPYIALAGFPFDLNLPADHIDPLPDYSVQAVRSRKLAAVRNLHIDMDPRGEKFKRKNRQHLAFLHIAKGNLPHENQPSSAEQIFGTSIPSSSGDQSISIVACASRLNSSTKSPGYLPSTVSKNGRDVIKGSKEICVWNYKDSRSVPQNTVAENIPLNDSGRREGSHENKNESNRQLLQYKTTTTQSSQNLVVKSKNTSETNSFGRLNCGNWEFVRIVKSKDRENLNPLREFFKAYSRINLHNQPDHFSIEGISIRRLCSIHAFLKNDYSFKTYKGLRPEFLRCIFLDIYYKYFTHQYMETLLEKDLQQIDLQQTDHMHEYVNSSQRKNKWASERIYTKFQTKFSQSVLEVSKISLVIIKSIYTLIEEENSENEFLEKSKEFPELLKSTWKDIFEGKKEIIESCHCARVFWESNNVNKALEDWVKTTTSISKKSSIVSHAWSLAKVLIFKSNSKLKFYIFNGTKIRHCSGQFVKEKRIYKGLIEFINKIIFLSNSEYFPKIQLK